MAQTSYAINMSAVAFPGQPFDTAKLKDITTALASAAIPYGVLVVRSSAASADLVIGKLPALTTDVSVVGSALGVSLADQARPQNPAVASAQYPINSAVSVMRVGRVWVQVEEAVSAGDAPFVRFAAGAGGSQLGAFRKSADTASAVALPSGSAVYLTGALAAGYALLELNLV